ncbi:MAG: ATP-binding protein [Clostridia bacterium]|nr:ATP-binding protein [Clostridia bacterium]
MELVMLTGVPASGKSREAEKYRRLGYRIHSSDAIRRELYGSEGIQGNAPEIFKILIGRTRHDLQEGSPCVIDASNLRRRRRMASLSDLRLQNVKKTCVIVLSRPETLLERNRLRSRVVPDRSIHEMLCGFETPYYYEGWDEIRYVYNDGPYRFPREAAASFDQENPYHALTLGAHLDAARDYARMNGFSPSVQEAAWYHDIGKMYTRGFLTRSGEATVYAHYYGHENYGAYLYLCEKLSTAVPENRWRETLYIAGLINWHMCFVNKWPQNPGSQENDRKLMGEGMFRELEQLSRADAFAHERSPL